MGFEERLFDDTGLWLAASILFFLLASAAEMGALLRTRLGRDTVERSDGEGYLLSAILALLGLLIAFTFSLAITRFDARRALVVNEGNAIGTAWLRAGLAGGGTGVQLQHAIADYTDVRLGLSRGTDPARIEAATGVSQAIVWKDLQGAIAATPPPIAATIVTAVNEMFDAASSRKAERAARIPTQVLLVLVLYAVAAATIVGYVMRAAGRRHRAVTLILFLLLTLALALILDLDRPTSGAITVSQQPMLDARMAMR
ncbi:hypothetical protein [Sphingomonas sp. MMS24-J13]|uniref:bestrophin-like domain n=1 Tax=Sphingomonas sp. MMS24-J13 TaxID=3238686 RepID=UPI00384B8561